MGAGHGHRLHFHGHSAVHRLPAQCKLLALVLFVLCVVATPRTAYWAYALDAAALGVCIAASRVPVGYLAKRMLIELPFVVFALLLPFIALGDRTVVLGVEVSAEGLEAGLSLLAKATLGVVGGLLLAATTEPRDLLAGLEGRLPRQLIQIMAMMVRYLDVTSDQMRRMRIARESRGFVARNPRHWPVLAQGAGALFVRSYERGERVHLAMVSRGYVGQLPGLVHDEATTREWVTSLALPTTAAVAAVAGWWLR
ncbi:MAG: cobalt ECF transporter T component CbiQ [Actinomycetota bacterium]|nr:cobalt ECF transporter T component CbiQ [Nocardioidaceae bacterium]MDQ3480075.1 cobalt ECF transporter T component CbiQ [Actinomycetota bacterium]